MLNLTSNHSVEADNRTSSSTYAGTVSHIIGILGLLYFIFYSFRLVSKRYGIRNVIKLKMSTRRDIVLSSTRDAENVNNTSPPADDDSPIPSKVLSVNYHFTRRCNYRCGFCFHTAKTSFELPIDKAKEGLRLLKEAGMEKVNFSGGEPFLPNKGDYLGELARFCKQDLLLPSVSIVSNGSLIREHWFVKYGQYVDILAVSCDSFEPDTNAIIGRQHGSRTDHIAQMRRVRDWCDQYQVAFKINAVINTHNKDEDMSEPISELCPIRWKVFQCLLIDGENAGEESLRNAESFVITDDDFQNFLQRHSHVTSLVPESNQYMRYSYIIIDEYMRFLDGGTKKPSPSILDVGVANAINCANFDSAMFLKRGGRYTWTKADMRLDW